MANQKSETGSAIRYHYYLQYHLHLQLKAACRYAHENGVILKGDIPIGINRHGADAWQRPELFNLGVQAGAPPDGFAVKGQNWGFPTYNWEKMKEDGFGWWKLRFEQMAGYFDAFRIDHILGFFRIWSIPLDSVEGIMGHFVPAIPVHLDELRSHGVWHDAARFTQPFITEKILWDLFGYDNVFVKERFLDKQYEGRYAFKETYDNQRKIERELSAWNDEFLHPKNETRALRPPLQRDTFRCGGQQRKCFPFQVRNDGYVFVQTIGPTYASCPGSFVR